ncbi:MAG: AAA family ATPase [Lachnospiraceae bacterium]|nr:AAA family ATPase [Lachnospiraceae bacterium]
MNIKQAKEYIKETARLYLKKDDLGDYIIPVVRQRPIFLLGAPGVGKTAIMEQVAAELGIALVSYSMTHHTRQSAIGLPFIRRKEYGGEEYDVTEYTMSEIIASVYDTMEESGINEGILFLDEINCVSETLSPSMLQFLQYKVFGRHHVPDGWVIVTAGNPPEYNKAVREFDVAVLDRLKVISVEPDYRSFKDYAVEKSLHPAILNFLDIKREYFYKIENTGTGRSYVTARGWEDLSDIITLYEEEGLKPDDTLIGQYIRNDAVVREFSAYYDLFNKYKRDYHVSEILEGEVADHVYPRVAAAPFDERLSLLSMLMDRITYEIRENIRRMDQLSKAAPILKGASSLSGGELGAWLDKSIEGCEKNLFSKKKAGALAGDEERILRHTIKLLKDMRGLGSFEEIKALYNERVEAVKQESIAASSRLHNLFVFCEKAFAEGNEMLIFVTQLTVNPYTSRFIARFGSSDYEKHQDELMLTQRRIDMQSEVKELLNETI